MAMLESRAKMLPFASPISGARSLAKAPAPGISMRLYAMPRALAESCLPEIFAKVIVLLPFSAKSSAQERLLYFAESTKAGGTPLELATHPAKTHSEKNDKTNN